MASMIQGDYHMALFGNPNHVNLYYREKGETDTFRLYMLAYLRTTGGCTSVWPRTHLAGGSRPSTTNYMVLARSKTQLGGSRSSTKHSSAPHTSSLPCPSHSLGFNLTQLVGVDTYLNIEEVLQWVDGGSWIGGSDLSVDQMWDLEKVGLSGRRRHHHSPTHPSARPPTQPSVCLVCQHEHVSVCQLPCPPSRLSTSRRTWTGCSLTLRRI